MKEIQAIIQPFMTSKVVDALNKIPHFPGLTMNKVQGFGREKGKGAHHRIVEDLIDYVPKVKIEMIVNDDMADEVIKAIRENAYTGNKGDGKIFIHNDISLMQFVIPGLTRNPVFFWISAFAGMTPLAAINVAVYIYDVRDAIRIRTGESGESAI